MRYETCPDCLRRFIPVIHGRFLRHLCDGGGYFHVQNICRGSCKRAPKSAANVVEGVGLGGIVWPGRRGGVQVTADPLPIDDALSTLGLFCHQLPDGKLLEMRRGLALCILAIDGVLMSRGLGLGGERDGGAS